MGIGVIGRRRRLYYIRLRFSFGPVNPVASADAFLPSFLPPLPLCVAPRVSVNRVPRNHPRFTNNPSVAERGGEEEIGKDLDWIWMIGPRFVEEGIGQLVASVMRIIKLNFCELKKIMG